MKNVALILKAPKIVDEVKESEVIYADAGYKFSERLKNKKTIAVVGDFDSLGAPPEKERAVTLSVQKDFTDGERAVKLAKELGFEGVTIYGANGGKIEHILGNLALLKIAKSINLQAKIIDAGQTVRLISGIVSISAKKGTKLSLIPYGGECEFIKSEGLFYPLDGINLTPNDTMGISNEVINESVFIQIKKGEALLIYTE